MRPTLTVVIPSRDRPALARRAAACALRQVDVDVQVVVVDDESVQPLSQALADLVASSSGRLTVVRTEGPEGVAGARNRGVFEAEGEWVGFCDDDDLWAPTKARSQIAAPEAASCTWTCSGAIAVSSDLEPLSAMVAPSVPDVAPALLAVNVIPGGASSVIARTSVVRQLGGFDASFSTLADWDMWIRLARSGPLLAIQRPLVAYLIHAAGMSNDTRLLEHDLVRLESKYRAEREELGVEISKRSWMNYLARMHLRAGRRWAATRALAQVAVHDRTMRRWKGIVVAAVAPGVVLARRADIAHRNIPPDWAAEARAWLDEIDTPVVRAEQRDRASRVHSRS